MTRTGYRQRNEIRLNGDGSATIIASNGDRIIIDEGDIEIVRNHTWSTYPSPVGNTRYARARINEMSVRLHTFLLYGADAARGRTVDHVDRNGLNNRRSNLRQATQRQNNANTGIRKDNTSGFKGVSLHAKSGRWLAKINPETGVQKYLGLHDSPEAAARAYDAAAIAAFGPFASTNFPHEQHA